MNHFEVLNACMRAIDRCRGEGYTPNRLFLPYAAIEALKRFPIDMGVTVTTISELRGVPIEVRETNPCVAGKRSETLFSQFTVDLPCEETPAAPEPVRLSFEVRVKGSYAPPREVYGGVTDPEQMAAMDEGRIIKDLPRFLSILPTIAPDADIEVNVEPETPQGDAFTAALSKLARADTFPSAIGALMEVAQAEQRDGFGNRAWEFTSAVAALQKAAGHYRRGVEGIFLDETA